MKQGGGIGIGTIVIIVIAIALLTHHGGSNHKSASVAATPSSTAAPSSTSSNFEIILSQSSCQEQPDNAEVACSIGVKNRGLDSGLPVVYAFYRYNDQGSSFDQSDNGECGGSDSIPAGDLGFVYFCHPYDAVKHDLLRVAVSLNQNAARFPYVAVVDPGESWP